MNLTAIREATPDDAEAIARLVNEAFRRERFFIDQDRTDPQKVRDLMQKGTFFLMEETRGLSACVYVEVRGERGYFGLLSVDPAKQRSGLGSQLIAAAEKFCRASGCRVMDLTIVNLRTELPAFYRQRGYSESGTEAFPAAAQAKMPCHLVRMSKPL
jgi:N-acetylglutamate synthase-like GNAT family acetyltransferase